mgnify:CR=1 FL=1
MELSAVTGLRKQTEREGNMKGHYLDEARDFQPDWQELFLPGEAEEELTGFKFNGPGWYLTEDTILVLPIAGAERFLFCVYTGRDATESFNQIINAPVRLDTRRGKIANRD